jgi:SPP1 family predicted phage head-tail adaptor
MRISEFTHLVRIESAPEVRSASGASRYDWDNAAVVGERRAKIEIGDGREVYRARQIMPEVEAVITIRGRLNVSPRMRVVHADGRKWDIVGVETTDGKSPIHAEAIRLNCIQGVRQGS